MTTKEEQLQWEVQAYGMSKKALDHMVKTQAFPGQEMMFAAGLLSDAQEILAEEWNPDGVSAYDANRVRQLMNCAKAIMFDVMDPSRRDAMKETA